MIQYTIGIKRRFFPGFKKYRVTNHRTQFNIAGVALPHPRMVLTLLDGSELAIACIDTRDFMLYGDFAKEQARVRREAEIETEKRLYDDYKKMKAQAAQPAIVPDEIPITKQA